MPLDLSDNEKATLAELLRTTIAADRFPLSPRVRSWKSILDKLEPPAPKRESLPPLKPPGEPTTARLKMRVRRR